MNVYIIIKSEDNGVDTWESIVDLYKNESTAVSICEVLNANSDQYTDYYVREHLVIEI